MKKIWFFILLCFLQVGFLRADEPASVAAPSAPACPDCVVEDSAAPAKENRWITLGKKSDAIAEGVRTKDIHSLHELDAEVGELTADLEKNEPAGLPDDRKKKLNNLLIDIATQATTIHHDAHAAKWDDAEAAQGKLAADLKAAKSLVPTQY